MQLSTSIFAPLRQIRSTVHLSWNRVGARQHEQPRSVVSSIIPGPIAQRDHKTENRTYVSIVATNVNALWQVERVVGFDLYEGDTSVGITEWIERFKQPDRSMSLEVVGVLGETEKADVKALQIALEKLLDKAATIEPYAAREVASAFLDNLSEIVKNRLAT